MASESKEEQTVSVALPDELVEWLETEADAADVDRETLLAQLVATYQTAQQFEGELDGGAVLLETGAVLESVEGDFADQISEATKSVQQQLGARLDTVESEFQEKLQDVRHRVVQLKKETDEKAPADHAHPEFEEVSDIADQLTVLQSELEQLRAVHEETASEHSEAVESNTAQLDELHDRLQTVAWVVSDLRKAQQKTSGLEAVERIKRVAARADVKRAVCENCGEGVTLALMTDPECPHCEAVVTNVEPAKGWFGKSVLTVAKQLESGEER